MAPPRLTYQLNQQICAVTHYLFVEVADCGLWAPEKRICDENEDKKPIQAEVSATRVRRLEKELTVGNRQRTLKATGKCPFDQTCGQYA